MIRATMEPGRLIIVADNQGRSDLALASSCGGYRAAEAVVSEELHDYFEFIQPETIGALTDAPILADAYGLDWPDDADSWVVAPGCRIFWFPDYMIRDPWDILKNTGRVEFMEATRS